MSASATSNNSPGIHRDEAVPAGLAFISERVVAAGMDPLTCGAQDPHLLCQLRAGDGPAAVCPAPPGPCESTERWLQEALPFGFAMDNSFPGALKGTSFNNVLNGLVISIWTILLPLA